MFSEGSECRMIYFVVNGSLELIVEDGREVRVLDVLSPGSNLGAYTVLNSSTFKFSGRAQGIL